jgi:hypothetical protein
MTSPSDLASLAKKTGGTELDERSDLLIIRGALDDKGIRDEWLRLRATPPDYIVSISISDSETDLKLEDDAPPDAGDVFRIIVSKRVVENELRLFFAASLSSHLNILESCNRVAISELRDGEVFASEKARFQLWSVDPADPYAESEPLTDPRVFAHDFSGKQVVPNDIRPWLLRTPPRIEGEAYRIWRRAASRSILAALCDQVYAADSDLVFHFNGPPARDVRATDVEIEALFPLLSSGASWVFKGARDTEVRHLLLANEWARTHRTADGLNSLGDGALESAKSAYNAYVKSSGRETLQALASLRRSVLEESQKISERSQALTGYLWKDLALAASPFVLKIFSDSLSSENDYISGGLSIVAAAFLVFAFAMHNYINYKFFSGQKASRIIWKQSLNTVLSQSELHQFAEEPIKKSVDNYVQVAIFVGIFYLALVSTLTIFGLHSLDIIDWFDATNSIAPLQEPSRLIEGESAADPTLER